MSDLTEPIVTTETCPRGHVLTAEQVVIRDGMKVCPLCEQEAAAWASPAARHHFWSRRLLRWPLVVLAAAVFGLGISSAFDIASNGALMGHGIPGTLAQLIGSIFATMAELALAAGVGWIAYAVGLEDQPR